MKNMFFSHKDNRGASLMAVLIALMFVSTMGIIVAQLTVTNIEMKAVEQSSKKNFYDAEAVMDAVSVQVNSQAAVCLQSAYIDVLSEYKSILENDQNADDEFRKFYMNNMVDHFWVSNSADCTKVIESADGKVYDENGNEISEEELNNNSSSYVNEKYYSKMTSTGDNVNDYRFVSGYYDKNKLTQNLATNYKSSVLNNLDWGKAVFTADYVKGVFTIQNVTVVYTDAQGYETTITTDLVFKTPSMSLDGEDEMDPFMDYILIADKGISLASDSSINGSIYAGVDGVYTTASDKSYTISGNYLVTRGDINVAQGNSLTIGNSSHSMNVWAENIVTSGSSKSAGKGATLSIDGNIYVADDLTLDGFNSKVTLSGKYFGYNFQEKYTETDASKVEVTRNADFSSAIIINAQGSSEKDDTVYNSRIDMTGLSQLYLAGRAYISRGSSGNLNNANDIMTGESISVRTNQLIYNVDAADVIVNNSTQQCAKDLTDDAWSRLASDAGYSSVNDFKKLFVSSVVAADGDTVLSSPITTYYYYDTLNDGANRKVEYYLNFKDAESANSVFKALYDASAQVSSGSYIGYNAILLDDGNSLTLSGDYLVADASGKYLDVKSATLGSTEEWLPGSAAWVSSNSNAIKYRSLQTYLEDDYTGINETNVRFYDAYGNIDKSVESLVQNLVKLSGDSKGYVSEDVKNCDPTKKIGEAYVPYSYGEDGSKTVVALVNNTDAAYNPPANFQYGIIIATGDVNLTSDFTGMIISGGTITLNNCHLYSDSELVKGLFEKDMTDNEKGKTWFVQYFSTYNDLNSNDLGTVSVKDFFTYDNWSKNGD